jgi:DNA-binding SARP family transcriptional activator
VAEDVWRRSPAAVCLVFDDVHLLPPGSQGARWLAELVEALPANGHVLLGSRTDPPLPVRLRTTGALRLIAEEDLRFSGDELAGFASRRGLQAGDFADTGGWPAMAELTASAASTAAGGHLAGAYVWEEVLEPLGDERRRVLAVVSDLGGADDELATAALGRPVDLRTMLDGVPLVARSDDGARVPHPLWRTAAAAALALPSGERDEARRRATDHLVGRGRFEDALALVVEAQAWDQAPAVLRAACVSSEKPTSAQLRRWLDACPESVHETPAGLLAAGLHAAFVDPGGAAGPLQKAARACEDIDDVDGALAAMAELGRIAWWSQDQAALAGLGAGVTKLAETGHPLALGLAAFGLALVADVMGDDAGVLAALDTIDPGVLDDGWRASALWLRARILLATDQQDAGIALLDEFERDPVADPVLQSIFAGLRTSVMWARGQIDEVLSRLVRSLDATTTAAGVEHNRHLLVIAAASMAAQVGQLDLARRLLSELGWSATFEPSSALGQGFGDDQTVQSATARAVIHLASGDEKSAQAELAAVAGRGVDQGTDRRTWRVALTMTYVLLPETRPHWDSLDLNGGIALQRALGRAIVAVRSAGGAGGLTERELRELPALRDLELPDPQRVRALLHYRYVVELAAALDTAGRPEGAALLEATGPAGRDALRDLAASDKRWDKPARSLLANVPAPPPMVTRVSALGPLVVAHASPSDGEWTEVNDPDLRRERVRTLLAFLVTQRRTTRSAILAALWPDLDERSGANNLRVTLNYLLKVLEPWRPAGEPSYLVRAEGSQVELVGDEHLQIDVDKFDRHLDAATRAERDGAPSAALDHLLAAVDLHRGDLHSELVDAEWVDLDREHYRSRYVTVAVRAAQLLVGRGDPDDVDRAERLAQRTLAVDPWSEDAFGVLIAAALARGDRSGARRQLDRCTTALADLGLEPSEATRRLRRRIRDPQAA